MIKLEILQESIKWDRFSDLESLNLFVNKQIQKIRKLRPGIFCENYYIAV